MFNVLAKGDVNMTIYKVELSDELRKKLRNPKAIDDALNTPDNGERIAIPKHVRTTHNGGGDIAVTNPLEWDVDRLLCQVM